MGDDLKFIDTGKGYSNVPPSAPEMDVESQLPAGPETDGAARESALAPGFLKTAKHPGICIAHWGFKLLALFTFLFGDWFAGYITTFVFTTLFLSFDFWTVKNVTGRILVGMRWWNDIKEDGTSEWLFECANDERVINNTDKIVFWSGIYVWPIIWVVLFLAYIISFQFKWALLIAMGIALSTSNTIGYMRCSKDQKNRVQEWAKGQAMQAVLGRFI
uniref:Golgi apparatus membrane protein TVP23 homolog n=1 Tax=Chromera velia CCMP2878 TaxID=1169474 RepID=A0A0G4H9S9_9ALVE|mmetsp:Transcript_11193/g.21673  ORF Transcript_11193/g.21673 Transcript_11193/m.21673 type:complete len:217 (+) Transcript_11193:253-903(+)|eukprot:Cvel_6020.t1-p1 / transcript=Cvel_6020.t1 / gene=Cvel_6020 / organism=Chromera_velia_CCMP2878 / gene_product=Golgi apparatus membrane protein TVP23, putative / transcript_product=Golgi apparatus membrane protein TVP23, putative / location=Cvel_scaffold288:74898-75545(+) / protein_length=216 / sequence_SO=supercontig / SO=protein_coding / is_pseudo=false